METTQTLSNHPTLPASLPIDQIDIQEGFNPRRYFSDDALNDLTESIKAQGVIQSVLVRPSGEGRYHLIAGERRFRAAKQAGLTELPVQVRDLDDQAALAAATAENGDREDISVAEEARLAQRAISVSDGDRDEAAKLLGWKRSRVDARLLLLHACDAVLDALERREILVGHAELLATIPKTTQEGTLGKIIADEISVADLKGKIGEFTRELARARFDTAACQGCPFNSSTQASLFDFSVGPGRCSNAECWSTKNQQHIDAVVAEQQANYPAIYRDSERDATTRTMLIEQGSTGVGPDQFAACKSCQFYGAVVSSEPGREGAVTEGVCFNMTCNKAMVKAFAKAQRETAEQARKDSETAPSGASDQSAGKASNAPARTKPASKPAAIAGTPKAVTEKADAFVREQAVREGAADGSIGGGLSLFGLFQMADTSADETVKKALDQFGMATHQAHSPELLTAILAADTDTRRAAHQALTTHLLGVRTNAMSQTNWQEMAKATLAHRQPDLTATFTLDEAFLRVHTKSGMEALLMEAGFDAWYDAQTGHNKGAFAKLMKAKVDVIVAKVLPATGGFDFTGFVPASVYKQAGIAKPAPIPAA